MSGKAMQAADSPAESVESEKSRTESEGQARPLFLLLGGALATPKWLLRTRKRCILSNHWKNI